MKLAITLTLLVCLWRLSAFYEFLRNDAFDATNFFANRSGAEKPLFKQNQFGGAIGGPVIKNIEFQLSLDDGESGTPLHERLPRKPKVGRERDFPLLQLYRRCIIHPTRSGIP